MEAIIGYVVIFGFGIIIASLYLFRKEKKSLLPISEQTYPHLVVTTLLKKERRKTTEIVLQLTPLKNALTINEITLELTNKKHEKKLIDLRPHLHFSEKEQILSPPEKTEFSIAFQHFISLLNEAAFPYERFRLVAGTPEGKRFKSHELGYHPRWGIFKADSGKYN